jgi:2',3'-cyclic-nucleotide 2'-phosphodiesterase / 3'-nucleotidase / 5'-nucleotidase
MRSFVLATALASTLLTSAAAFAGPIGFSRIWERTPGGGVASAEIPAYDAALGRIYVAGVSGVDVLDARTGARITTILVPGGGVNSVAVHGGKLAISADGNGGAQAPGRVFVYNTGDLTAPSQTFSVGAVPDMLTFTRDGSRLLVANEGEANNYLPGNNNPEGSVSVITLSSGTVQTAGFGGFSADALRANGVRIYSPNPDAPGTTASAAQDLEPEYIALSPDGAKAFVTLQENNAFAVLDIASATIERIIPLGYKDHGAPGNRLDPNDQNGRGTLISVPNLFGMYQPDTVVSTEIGGRTFYITANEGDARSADDFPGFEELARLATRPNAGLFPAAAGRLEVTTTPGVTGFPGGAPIPANAEFTLGGRSFSIWDENGNLVYDSGERIEAILASQFPQVLDDGRSDNKGPEPEAVEIGMVNGRMILFVGLERAANGSNAIMMFDITDFTAPVGASVGVFDGPDFVGLITEPTYRRPEGLKFWSDGVFSYLTATFEGSNPATRGTVTYMVSEPALAGVFGLGVAGLIALRLRRKQG